MSHHIVSVRSYTTVFVALLVLTVITVVVAQFDFGVLNLPIALAVATVKATLVAAVFMGLKYEKGVNPFALVISVLCLLLFIGLTFADITTRGAMDPLEDTQFGLETPVKLVEPGAASHGEHGDSNSHH